jgi:transposase-like protein
VSIGAIFATGVNRAGRRFLRGLQQRGLAGVELAISDSHKGLKA